MGVEIEQTLKTLRSVLKQKVSQNLCKDRFLHRVREYFAENKGENSLDAGVKLLINLTLFKRAV